MSLVRVLFVFQPKSHATPLQVATASSKGRCRDHHDLHSLAKVIQLVPLSTICDIFHNSRRGRMSTTTRPKMAIICKRARVSNLSPLSNAPHQHHYCDAHRQSRHRFKDQSAFVSVMAYQFLSQRGTVISNLHHCQSGRR